MSLNCTLYKVRISVIKDKWIAIVGGAIPRHRSFLQFVVLLKCSYNRSTRTREYQSINSTTVIIVYNLLLLTVLSQIMDMHVNNNMSNARLVCWLYGKHQQQDRSTNMREAPT